MESELPVFGPKSQEAKVEDFERSTLDLVLQQLEHTKAEVKAMRNAIGDEGWNFEWYNEQGLTRDLTSWPPVCSGSTSRGVLPATHSDLIKAFFTHFDDMPGGYSSFAMIFRVHEWGRMVATSLPLPDTNHIHATVRGKPVRIAVMSGFFAPWSKNNG